MYKSAKSKNKVEDNIEYDVDNESDNMIRLLKDLFGY